MTDEGPFQFHRKVIRADQSPLNEERWCVVLDCGHEIWMTKQGKTRRPPKSVYCYMCENQKVRRSFI